MRLSKVIVRERIGEALIEIEGAMKKLTMHKYRRCCHEHGEGGESSPSSSDHNDDDSGRQPYGPDLILVPSFL